MEKFDVAVIGGGILGTTISFWISNLYDLKICLIEKNLKLHNMLAVVTQQ